jgi:beta-glucosidase
MTIEVTSPLENAPYRDPRLPVPERVADLMSHMTLGEKLGQLASRWVFEFSSDTTIAPGRVQELCPDGVGEITRIAGASDHTPQEAAQVANLIQRQLVDGSRLGIPAIVHEEICSGMMGRGSTTFPQAIGVASTFDPSLNHAIADVIRVQMRAAGAHQGLSPVLDVCRDPRWGRTEETYGEDPYLAARMGVAFVKGLQGPGLATGVIATAKHFVGYGVSEGGLNWAPAHVGARELREVYLHPFEMAVKVAGLAAVMNGYHELDGVPCAANAELMRSILRDEWGFDGIVVSDYFSIDQLHVYHHVAGDRAEAAAIALTSGIDVELPSVDCYDEPLRRALAAGLVQNRDIDAAVRRILRLKFELGLFEHPYVSEAAAQIAGDTPEHRNLAFEVAAKSLVLLANDGILPLNAPPPRIAVIGPNANDARNLYGGYSYPAHVESLMEMRDHDNVFRIPLPDHFSLADLALPDTSILQGLRDRFGDAVRHAKGCGINDDDDSGFAEAVELASTADVVVLVVGDKAGLTEDCTSGETRDRSSLELPGLQEQLAEAVIATGTPVITVLVVGRPCGSAALHEGSAAVLLAWLPGQEGGRAVASAIAGDVNPGGKLPITFPRSVGQVPVFYGHKVSGGRSHWKGDYVDGPTAPMYPFGYGSSYTTFELRDAAVDCTAATADQTVGVSVVVTNTGSIAGDEVVQLYVFDPVASVTRPVLELKSFARVSLEPGETRRVMFRIPVAQLGFHTTSDRYVVESGTLEFQVGTSSRELLPAGSVEIDGDVVEKVFDGTVTIA